MHLCCSCELCVIVYYVFCDHTFLCVFVFCILVYVFNICMSLMCFFLQILCDCVFMLAMCNCLCLDVNAWSGGPFGVNVHS